MQQEIGGRDFHRDIDSAMDSCQLILEIVDLIHRMVFVLGLDQY